ncbi:MAG TPA: hypothetical protein VHT53_14050 [Candidatus Elarobacter sp.]|jgi:hypothetical protein|nr:hypothetical protein [Candidatus Elarobacter sp.]
MADAAVTTAAINAWLASSPAVVRERSPMPDRHDEYVVLRGTDNVQGYVSADTASRAALANGQPVMLVPLDSGGSGTVFSALVYTVIGGRTRFVGYIPSPAGHLGVHVVNGRIAVRTPVYGANDPNCCPSAIHVEHDTLRGLRLVRLDAHDEPMRRPR